ncbi:PIR Superfamily Protein [Plasmodium ovale wallikeri]|uniref:PIR Superfamily Protein n=1 Tax=Plasmodium ovale wallikeri TaxID=864142 RepID=A0A1A9A7C1_PLAOA|nr:PIR Superfamily Protein [Plasmodium ovale wallikeri]SBT55525.1 PIR Superfamily Protein [Plasmodium ovale wallikeri]
MPSNHGDLYSLPSRTNYRILDKTILVHDYFSECNDNNIPDMLKKLNGFDKICKMIAYNLYQFDRIPSYGHVVKNSCEVLKFWAYDKLFQSLTDSVRDDINTIRVQFGNLWNKFENKHECTFDMLAYDQENFNNLKVFYDYANDYAHIKLKAQNHDFTCTKEYKEYIERGNEIYNKITRECSNPDSNNIMYCMYVQQIMNHYRGNILTKLDCTVKSPQLSDEEEEEYTAQPLGPLGKGPKGESASLMVDSHSSNAHELSPSHSTVPMTIGSSLFGILFISFIFYKFTPLGSWVRERFLRRKMFGLNEQEVETHDLLEHEYDPLNMNAENSNHHIRYELSSFS